MMTWERIEEEWNSRISPRDRKFYYTVVEREGKVYIGTRGFTTPEEAAERKLEAWREGERPYTFLEVVYHAHDGTIWPAYEGEFDNEQ